jgi:hypothetical protein
MPFRVTMQEIKQRIELSEEKIGGSILSTGFFRNPQYLLTLPQEFDFQIKVDGPTCANIMIVIIKTINDQTDIKKIPYQHIFKNINPGFYFQGFSFLEATLSPGKYIILFSLQTEKNCTSDLEVNIII